MLVTRIDPCTGKSNTQDLPITQAQIDSYNSGTLLQYAFPNLNPSQREFYKTGITEESWNDLFSNDEE